MVRRSGVDAVLREEGDRVDVAPVVGARADLEVQVRAGHVAGRAGDGDLLTLADALPGRDLEGGEVGVLAVVAVGVLDDDLVAVGAAPTRRDDRAGGDGLDRGTGVDREVGARVAVRPQAAVAAVAAALDAVDGRGPAGARGGLLGGGGRGRGLLHDELRTGLDDAGVGADGALVLLVELLPAAGDLLLLGDLDERVTGLDGVRRVLRGARGVGAAEGGERERHDGGTGGAEQREATGERAAVGRGGHADSFSVACGVSCRVRAGAARPPARCAR
ncbi:putative secreted peptidase [Streptomyces sp. Tu6071]|nr:putative secreted peptidase [Streptomyces sp. Tu6071]